MDIEGTGGLILIPHRNLPDGWVERATEVMAVRLKPQETDRLLEQVEPLSGISDAEAELVRLLSEGLSTKSISRKLGISTRSVQRRVALIRNHYGLEPRADLGLFLAYGGRRENAGVTRHQVSQAREESRRRKPPGAKLDTFEEFD